MTISIAARQLKVTGMNNELISAAGTQSAIVTENSSHAHVRDRGLLLIGLFKLGKAILFFCIGVGVLHLLHKDLGDELLKLATALKFDPESRLVAILMEKADMIDAHRLKEIGFATFGYSALALTEGVGLLMEQVWAEYLTLILTISFLPWELYELARRPNWFRLGLLVINLLVLAYLVWLLQRKKQRVSGQGIS